MPVPWLAGKTEMIFTPMAGGLASTAGMAASAEGTADRDRHDGAQQRAASRVPGPGHTMAIRGRCTDRCIAAAPRAVAPSMASMLRGACTPASMTELASGALPG